jgi:hypothetical protein
VRSTLWTSSPFSSGSIATRVWTDERYQDRNPWAGRAGAPDFLGRPSSILGMEGAGQHA